jgi:hypothetical protein
MISSREALRVFLGWKVRGSNLYLFRVSPDGERGDFPLARVTEVDKDALVLSAGEDILTFLLLNAVFDLGQNLPQVTRNLFVSVVDVVLGDGSRLTLAEHPPE